MKIFSHFQQSKIRALDITAFFRQFSTLIAAGVSIIQACEILEQSQSNHAFRRLIYKIKKDISSGRNFFQTIILYRQYFDDLTCHLIQIGENTGKLDITLMMIAHHLEKKLWIRKKIQQALFYPTVIFIFSIVVSFCLFYFLVPSFAQLFKNHEDQLPRFTRIIFYLSLQLHDYIFPVFGLFLFTLIFLVNSRCIQPIQSFFTFYLFKFPPLKKMRQKIICAKFSRCLALTLEAGIPISQALLLAAQPCHDQTFLKIITELRQKLNAGLSIYRSFESALFFPNLMIQMIKTGEESGKLEEMLNKIADFFEADIEQLLTYFHQLLEPLIMGVLGVLIGGLVLSLYLPIFKLGSTL